MKELLLIILSASLLNNVVLNRFLGLCPFLGTSKKIETAAGMGIAIIVVMTITSAITSLIFNLILIPLNLQYLKIIVFILFIAGFVQITDIILKNKLPSLHKGLGVYLPLITTNCAVLGIPLLNIQNNYDLLTSTVNGFGTALGFTAAIIIMAGIRERTAVNDVSETFKGTPLALITAGLMAIAFYGFTSLV